MIFFAILINLSFILKGQSEPVHSINTGKHYVFDEAARKKIANDILQNLVNEKYEEVRKDFHAGLKQNLDAEKISEAWAKQAETLGTFDSVLSTTTAVFQSMNQVKLRCKYKQGNSTLEVTFDQDDKVIALFLKP